jgi:hypothetical protein
VCTKESLDIWKWDGGSLINNYKVRVPYFIRIIGEDELYELSMAFEDIDSEDSTIELFIVTIHFLKVLPLLVVK